MANELKRVYGTPKTLEASGASISSGAIGQANDADWNSTDTADFPDAVFALKFTATSAMTAGSSIDLIIQPMNFNSTDDAETPTASYLNHYFGSFYPTTSTSAQTLYLEVQNIPKEGRAWIYNANTGQSIPATWTLIMTPLTVKPI